MTDHQLTRVLGELEDRRGHLRELHLEGVCLSEEGVSLLESFLTKSRIEHLTAVDFGVVSPFSIRLN